MATKDIFCPNKTRQVVLHPCELADVYTLRTLADYLSQSQTPFELFVDGQTSPYKVSLDQVVITTYCDMPHSTYNAPQLQIDIAILKNCAVPVSQQQKAELRQKYELPSDRPVAVIGFATGNERVAKLVEQLAPFAEVYLVGYGFSEGSFKEKNVHCITEHGVLKDYYAMADIAFCADNLKVSHEALHNFVEATAGGPLFLVPSTDTRQYGYEELVRIGAIRAFEDLEQLLASAVSFVSTDEWNQYDPEPREEHIMATRSVYLPVIEQFILHLLGEAEAPIGHDLVAQREGTMIRLVHPESVWMPTYNTNESDNTLMISKTKLMENTDAFEDFLSIGYKNLPNYSSKISKHDVTSHLINEINSINIPNYTEHLSKLSESKIFIPHIHSGHHENPHEEMIHYIIPVSGLNDEYIKLKPEIKPSFMKDGKTIPESPDLLHFLQSYPQQSGIIK